MRNNKSPKSSDVKTPAKKTAPKRKPATAQTKKQAEPNLVLSSPAYLYCKEAVRKKTTPKYVKKQMRAWMPIAEGKKGGCHGTKEDTKDTNTQATG